MRAVMASTVMVVLGAQIMERSRVPFPFQEEIPTPIADIIKINLRSLVLCETVIKAIVILFSWSWMVLSRNVPTPSQGNIYTSIFKSTKREKRDN